MNNTTDNPVPPKSDPKPEQTCPHCGYCPHCGRANAETSTQDHADLAALMTDLLRDLANRETIAGNRVVGKPREGYGWSGQDSGGRAFPIVPPVTYKPSEAFETGNRVTGEMPEAWDRFERTIGMHSIANPAS